MNPGSKAAMAIAPVKIAVAARVRNERDQTTALSATPSTSPAMVTAWGKWSV
jgi:hypothetical protein